MAAIALTGGASALGIGVGLRKIGSHLISGIEIAFPQRDLNIKSALPLEISQDNPRLGSKSSPADVE
jgi:hypothetical protein